MASVSDATMIYNTRIVPSYISSNGYYGYVPPSNELVEHHSNYQQVLLDNNQHHELQHHNQQQPVRVTIGHGINVETSKYHLYNEQHYDYNNSLAMETGGDEAYIEDTQHRPNYHCVIPGTMRCLVNGCDSNSDNSDGTDGVGLRYHVANDTSDNVTISQRESRKRSYNDPAFLHGHGTGRMKKLRQGGGNNHVSYGTGRTREHGSAAVFDESPSLCLVSNITSSLKLYPSVANNCCAHIAAGNYSLITHKFSNCNCETKRCSITSTSPIDYENMLMETHGCSAYHHYRHQLLDIGSIENEF